MSPEIMAGKDQQVCFPSRLPGNQALGRTSVFFWKLIAQQDEVCFQEAKFD